MSSFVESAETKARRVKRLRALREAMAELESARRSLEEAGGQLDDEHGPGAELAFRWSRLVTGLLREIRELERDAEQGELF